MVERIDVLDKGYVRLVQNMGSDLDVVNAARASFSKEVTTLGKKDERLLSYLIKHKHDSCFRHCAMTFEIYAPLMVARQWWKHVVGSAHLDDQTGWNEASQRYITDDHDFYVPLPAEWRLAAEDKKQGSAGQAPAALGAKYTAWLLRTVDESERIYYEALADGIAPEQARLLLPAYGLYVRWRWTVSLNGVLAFLSLRLGHGAQSEIVQYANAVGKYVERAYPQTYAGWLAERIV